MGYYLVTALSRLKDFKKLRDEEHNHTHTHTAAHTQIHPTEISYDQVKYRRLLLKLMFLVFFVVAWQLEFVFLTSKQEC